MIGIWLLLALRDWQRFGIRKTPINVVVVLFFISMGISSIFGVDHHKSLWDSQVRMLGFVSLLHYLAFYLIATSSIKEWKSWKILFLIFLGVALVVLFIAIIQKFNPQFLHNRGLSRVGSTVGISSHFAGFCIATSFFSLLLFLKEPNKVFKTCFAIIGVVLLVAQIGT